MTAIDGEAKWAEFRQAQSRCQQKYRLSFSNLAAPLRSAQAKDPTTMRKACAAYKIPVDKPAQHPYARAILPFVGYLHLCPRLGRRLAKSYAAWELETASWLFARGK
jgi:hypothetical protein